MIRFLLVACCVVLFYGCSAKDQSLSVNEYQQDKLARDIMDMSNKIDKKEAYHLAKEALMYPKVLAKQYDLVTPANYHNTLINMGYRKRGFCYHWAEDIIVHLKKQKYKTIDLRWGVSRKGEADEHNSVVVVAKGARFETGILLDAWRNSGDLYWSKIPKDTHFDWVENKERTLALGTAKTFW